MFDRKWVEYGCMDGCMDGCMEGGKEYRLEVGWSSDRVSRKPASRFHHAQSSETAAMLMEVLVVWYFGDLMAKVQTGGYSDIYLMLHGDRAFITIHPTPHAQVVNERGRCSMMPSILYTAIIYLLQLRRPQHLPTSSVGFLQQSSNPSSSSSSSLGKRRFGPSTEYER